RDFGFDRLHQLGDRRLRPGPEANEDEAHPDLKIDWHQAELVLVEVRERTRAGGAPERAVEIVDPAMEGADQRVPAGALVVGDDAAAAMATDVVEAAHDAVLAADYQRALADHVHGQVVTGIGH